MEEATEDPDSLAVAELEVTREAILNYAVASRSLRWHWRRSGSWPKPGTTCHRYAGRLRSRGHPTWPVAQTVRSATGLHRSPPGFPPGKPISGSETAWCFRCWHCIRCDGAGDEWVAAWV